MIAVPVPLHEAIPLPDHFRHPSRIHGQRHVGRVMVHAMRLIDVLHHGAETRAALWLSVYLHDLERTHDYECHVHGQHAAKRINDPDVKALVTKADVPIHELMTISTAVTFHSLPTELSEIHPAWTLTALLKDADGLDRVRLGDLDPSYLRFRESRGMVDFAQRLFDASNSVPEGPTFFADLARLSLVMC